MKAERAVRLLFAAILLLAVPRSGWARQMPGMDMPGMDMSGMKMAAPVAWHFMSDGVLFATFDRQGRPRGETEFGAENWWMGMWSRPVGRSSFQFNAMFSLDAATVGRRGYSELFQAGETLDGRPIVDRQHPHDLVMQLAAIWRRPLGERTTLTLAGAPVGEPSLGPVAFMHRASASENPVAPLGHHTMDSSHVSMGVVTGALAHGPWTAEASVFNGREPDENRWDVMDPGRLDSWAARLWMRPRPNWELQVSHGLLTNPEPLEPGDVRRTTGSVGWMRQAGDDVTAVTAVIGHNDGDHGNTTGGLIETTRHHGSHSGYARFEIQQVETALALGGGAGEADPTRSTVMALTFGGVRDLVRARRFELGLGADVTVYGVPDDLQAAYGSRPASFHLFIRVRPAASAMGRMWNMTMIRPMIHDMALAARTP